MMKREQILSILYEMAVVIGGEVRLRPLLTKTLQRLLFHTSFPCGMIFLGTETVRSDGRGAEAAEVRLEISIGDLELAEHNCSAVLIPAALLRGGIELGDGGGLLNEIPCRKDYYKVFLRLPIDELGVMLLLAPRIPETDLPLTQIFQPVLNNFAKAIHLCRSYEAFTERIITDQRLARAALKDMSYRNRLILDSVGEGICGLDLDGNATFVNPAAARMLGFEPGELEGRPLHAIVHHRHSRDNDTAFNDCPIIRTMREGSRNRIDGDLFGRRDESAFPVEYVSTPLMEDGRIVGAVLVFRDITERIRAEEERRRAEKALEESSTLLRNIMDSSTDYILVKDRELRTMLCNEPFARARGKHPSDLYGKTDIENGWDPELVRGNPAKGIRGFEQDDLAALDGHVVHSEGDLGNIGGEIRVFDTVKLPLRDATGKIIGLVGVSRDITERKRAEDLLRSLNEQLEERVKERTSELEGKNAELERMNRLFVGRELRMVELKERIKELEAGSKRKEPFST